METKRELAEKQIELQDKVIALANINIVTCGHCGSVLLHELNDELITCACCKHKLAQSDCPDLWHEGCQYNSEFDDVEIYLGQIEQGISNIKVYAIDNGYKLYFYSNGNLMSECELLDEDQIWNELRNKGYKKYFCKAVLSML